MIIIIPCPRCALEHRDIAVEHGLCPIHGPVTETEVTTWRDVQHKGRNGFEEGCG